MTQHELEVRITEVKANYGQAIEEKADLVREVVRKRREHEIEVIRLKQQAAEIQSQMEWLKVERDKELLPLLQAHAAVVRANNAQKEEAVPDGYAA